MPSLPMKLIMALWKRELFSSIMGYCSLFLNADQKCTDVSLRASRNALIVNRNVFLKSCSFVEHVEPGVINPKLVMGAHERCHFQWKAWKFVIVLLRETLIMYNSAMEICHTVQIQTCSTLLVVYKVDSTEKRFLSGCAPPCSLSPVTNIPTKRPEM